MILKLQNILEKLSTDYNYSYMGKKCKMVKILLKRILGRQAVSNINEQIYFKKNPECKRALLNNIRFKNKYKGKRCFIIGNGPSLNNIDLSLLEREITFSVNQLPKNPDFLKLKTNFHMWADERFFELDSSRPEDMELLKVMQSVNSEGDKPIVFYKYSAYKMIKRYGLDEKLNIFYYMDSLSKRSAFKKDTDVDFTRLVPAFTTVIHYLICLAVFMGFKQIYLLGCDCTGFVSIAKAKTLEAEDSEYAYEISKEEKKRMERVAQKTSIRNELAWYVDLFDTYEILREYCHMHDVQLFNATHGGLLESLDRVTLEKALLDL